MTRNAAKFSSSTISHHIAPRNSPREESTRNRRRSARPFSKANTLSSSHSNKNPIAALLLALGVWLCVSDVPNFIAAVPVAEAAAIRVDQTVEKSMEARYNLEDQNFLEETFLKEGNPQFLNPRRDGNLWSDVMGRIRRDSTDALPEPSTPAPVGSKRAFFERFAEDERRLRDAMKRSNADAATKASRRGSPPPPPQPFDSEEQANEGARSPYSPVDGIDELLKGTGEIASWYPSTMTLSQARSDSAITFYDNTIIIAGGCTVANCSEKSALIEASDPSTFSMSVVGNIPVNFYVPNLANRSAPPKAVPATVAGTYSFVTVETIDNSTFAATSRLWMVGPCATYVQKDQMTYEDIVLMAELHNGLWGFNTKISAVDISYSLPANLSLRANASCIAYLNRIFIAGGIALNEIDADGNFVMLNTIDAYDVTNGQYYAGILTMQSPRMNAAIAVDNVMLYVGGGQSRWLFVNSTNDNSYNLTVLSTTVEAFLFSIYYLIDEGAPFTPIPLPPNNLIGMGTATVGGGAPHLRDNITSTAEPPTNPTVVPTSDVPTSIGSTTLLTTSGDATTGTPLPTTEVTTSQAETTATLPTTTPLSTTRTTTATTMPPPPTLPPSPNNPNLWSTPRIFSFAGYITMTVGTDVFTSLVCFGGGADGNASLTSVSCLDANHNPSQWQPGTFTGMEGQTGGAVFGFPSSNLAAVFGVVYSFYAVGGVLADGVTMSADVNYAFSSVHATNAVDLQPTYPTGWVTLTFNKIASGWLRLSANIDCYLTVTGVQDTYLNMSNAVDGKLNVTYLMLLPTPTIYLCFAFGTTNIVANTSVGGALDTSAGDSDVSYHVLYGCLNELNPFSVVTPTTTTTTTTTITTTTTSTIPTTGAPASNNGGFAGWITTGNHAIEFSFMVLAVLAVIGLGVFLFIFIRRRRREEEVRNGFHNSKKGSHTNTDDLNNPLGSRNPDLVEQGLMTDGGKFIFGDSDSIARNTTLDSRYRIVRRIGQGSFSSVYLVKRKNDNVTFAMKYLICENDRDRLEAIKECETINSIQGHPNIIALFDMFMNYEFGAQGHTPYTSTLQPRPSALGRLNGGGAASPTINAASPTVKSALLGVDNQPPTPPLLPMKEGGGGKYGAAAPASPVAPPASPLTATTTAANGQQRSIHTRYLCLIMEFHPSGDLCHFLLKSSQARRDDYQRRLKEFEAYWKSNNSANYGGGSLRSNVGTPSAVSMVSINRNSARVGDQHAAGLTDSAANSQMNASSSVRASSSREGSQLVPPPLPYYQPLNESALLSVAMQLCAALHHLHSCRPAPIVHRDLKPENVLIRGPLPSVHETFIPILITDFGLAFLQEENRRSGRGGGTRPYISPESWKGHTTTASDMWSLGCVLYALATERMVADSVRIMFEDAKHSRFKEDILRDLCEIHGYSLGLGQLILSLLEVDPRRRPTSGQLLQRFEELEISDERLDELLFPLQHQSSNPQRLLDVSQNEMDPSGSRNASTTFDGMAVGTPNGSGQFSPKEAGCGTPKGRSPRDGALSVPASSSNTSKVMVAQPPKTADQMMRENLTPEDVAQRHKTVRIRPFVPVQHQMHHAHLQHPQHGHHPQQQLALPQQQQQAQQQQPQQHVPSRGSGA